jgi:hypothetical protein
METSLFDKIYSYRERENKNSYENYFIEILAFCLNSDMKFRTDFFELIKIEELKNPIIKTQVVYQYGRPDIVISNSEYTILIECKIEHTERENQLNDYKNILLDKKSNNSHLIYLTKYYEFKKIDTTNIEFHQIKWADVYKLIEIENNQITRELKKYIKEQNMSDSNNFQYQDLSTLKIITSTIHKMDEVLDGIKPIFEEKIGKFSKDSSRSTRLTEERYVNWSSVIKDSVQQYSYEVGFYWWDDEDISIALRVFIPNKERNKNAKKILAHFESKLTEWEPEHFEESYNFWYFQPLAQFIIDDEEQIPEIIKFLEKGINELAKIKLK